MDNSRLMLTPCLTAAQMFLLLIQLIPNHICGKWIETSSKDTSAKGEGKNGDGASGGEAGEKPPPRAWYLNPFTQLIALWQFITVLLFSCIEFQCVCFARMPAQAHHAGEALT